MANLHIVELSENKVYKIIILMKNDFVVNKLFTALSLKDGIVFVSDINISVSAARYWPGWSHSNSLWTVPEHGFQSQDLKGAIPSVDCLILCFINEAVIVFYK